MKRTLFLCGAGNPEGVRLALTIQAKSSRWEELVLLDDDPAKHGSWVGPVNIAGPIDALREVAPGTAEAANLVARTTERRARVHARLAELGVPLATLVHPGVDTTMTEIGTGVQVYGNATVCAGASVGEGSVVFMNAVVGHGARVGAGCVLAPGAVINARVVLEDLSYVGTNGCVMPDVTVAARATVAACSVAMADVPPAATVIGVPGEIVASEVASEPLPSAGGSTAGDLLPEVLVAFRDVLGREVAPRRSLFEQGGTSKDALAIQAALRARGHALTIIDLFRHPTPWAIAEALARPTTTDDPRDARTALRVNLRRVPRRVG